MDLKLMLAAYDLIKKTIWNPKSINYSISEEIYRKYYIDREDMVHDSILLFMERKHNLPIRNLSKYINTFVLNALLDTKKYHSRQKRGDEYDVISLDNLIDKGYDIGYNGKIYRDDDF